MTNTKPDLKALVAEADEAFWQVVVHHYPEATSGDLSPLTTFQLTEAAENAVSEWIWANVPGMRDDDE